MRCDPELAELVLAELVEIVPGGVEEERGEGYVEYAIYGPPGEIPELPEIEAAAGDGLVEVETTEIPDDWADRWRDFHDPVEIGGWLVVRPSWEAPRAAPERLDIVIDPGRAFGTGAHATTSLSLELLGELAAGATDRGSLADLGTGSGVLAIAAAKLGFGPVLACDHEAAAVEAAAANAELNGVEIAVERRNLREQPAPTARVWLANLTAPLLRSVAGLMPAAADGGPERIIVSGLLGREREDVEAAFGARGYEPVEFRAGGDWGALLSQTADPAIFATMISAVTFYQVVLFVHITAVVLAFGPTFAYGVFAATAERMDPRSVPVVAAGIMVWNRVTQGMILLILAAGIYLVATDSGPGAAWSFSDFYVSWGFVAVIILGAMAGAFFAPRTRRLKEIAERDIAAAGDGPVTLSAEYQAVNRQLANGGTAAGIFVILTIYVMTAKPFQ